MSRRLALSQVVGESMIHIVEPVATQAVKFILARLGLTEMMKDEIYVVSDFKESSKSVDKDGNPKLITYRTTAKITPSVNPTNNKWEGMKTAIDLGNGNTIIRSSDAKSVKRPWSGHDVTDSNYSLFHDDDLVGDGHGLLLIMGHEHRGEPGLPLDAPDLFRSKHCRVLRFHHHFFRRLPGRAAVFHGIRRENARSCRKSRFDKYLETPCKNAGAVLYWGKQSRVCRFLCVQSV